MYTYIYIYDNYIISNAVSRPVRAGLGWDIHTHARAQCIHIHIYTYCYIYMMYVYDIYIYTYNHYTTILIITAMKVCRT